ncbi:hypothetical protein AB3S75_043660 [Citrus x aurantiifolia]
MFAQVSSKWSLLVVVFVVFLVLVSPAKSDEHQILMNLKSKIEKSDTGVFSSWTEANSVCKFNGIVCDSNGLVAEINLPEQQLRGVVPFDSICGLQALQKINLGTNFLNGTITEGLKSCTRLQVLDLGNNSFSGEVPDLSMLHELSFLNLNSSGFSGKFPWKSLENLTNLEFLSLGDNPFDQSPFPMEVLKLEKLYWLYLTNCSVTGQIPEGIGNLTQLQNLELSDNELSGEIPAGIVKLNKLWQLELYNNSLNGKLPVGFSNLTNLMNFDVSQNRLEGDLSELRFLNQLSSLHLFENQFSGEIPEEFGEFKHLTELSLYTNSLTGTLPQKLGSWADFNYVDVSENLLTGPIPPDMCKTGAMTDLLVLQNNFNGTVPETYANCKSLIRFRVNNNSLSGTIPPGIWSLPNLSIIDLSTNQFEGPVTDDIGSGRSHHVSTFVWCLIAVTMVLLVLLASYFVVKLKQNNLKRSLKQNSWDMKSFRVLSFSEKEIIDAVKPENLIGKGGSGNVYKVVLNSGKELAVKHIWPSNSSFRGDYRSSTAMLSKRSSRSSEYDAEVATLSAVRHVNVVKLYCSITSEDSNLLVYEYLPNGSLWDRLHTCHKIEMDWVVRYAIAVGAAKGLEYLHHGFDRPVIHRDVKSSNILLDLEWKPRIADFGLAKIVQAGEAGDLTHVIAGTHGYIAPEYAYTCKINEKSDVYSFGVVLMELVTGKRPIVPEFGDSKDIVNWVYSKMDSRDSMLTVVDPNISEILKEDALKVLRIAIHCTNKLPAFRPSMRVVVQMLEEAEPCSVTNIVVKKVGESSPSF